jgi:hypothetical protein
MTKPVEFWRWEIESTTPPGKRVKTSYRMTREEALQRDPAATPIPGTCEVRNVAENDDELARMHTHSGNSRAGKA